MKRLEVFYKFSNLILVLCFLFSVIIGGSVLTHAQIAPGKDTPPDQKKATPGIKLNQNSSTSSTLSSTQTTSVSTSQQQSVDPAIAISGSPTVRTGGAEVFAIAGIIILGGAIYYYQKKLKPLKSSLKTKEIRIKSK